MSQKQHYIPKILLNGFIDPNSKDKTNIEPYLWYYERGKEVKRSAPKNILWERNIYIQYNEDNKENNILEEFFSKKLENPFSQFKRKFETDLLNFQIEKLKTNGIESERVFLAAFVFWHWKRTKNFLVKLKKSFEFELLKDNSEDLVKEYMSSTKVTNDLLAITIELGNRFEDKNALEIIANKNIYFTVIDNPDTNFINSDNPLIRANENRPNGIIYPDTELTIPLTSKILLTFIGNGNQLFVRKINDKIKVRKLNQVIAKNSSEIIFGTSNYQLEKLKNFVKGDSA